MTKRLEIWGSILLGLGGIALLLQNASVAGFLSRISTRPNAVGASAEADPPAAFSPIDAWSMPEGDVDEPFRLDDRLDSEQIQIVRGSLPESADNLVLFTIPDRLCSVEALNEITDLVSELKEVNPETPVATLVLETDSERALHLASTLRLTQTMGVAKGEAAGLLGRFGREDVPQQMLIVAAGQDKILYRRMVGIRSSNSVPPEEGSSVFRRLLSLRR